MLKSYTYDLYAFCIYILLLLLQCKAISKHERVKRVENWRENPIMDGEGLFCSFVKGGSLEYLGMVL